MERILIEAWEQIEAQELINEGKKRGKVGKVTAVKSSPKGKVTAVKGKISEEGVGGPAGAGVGSASNTAAKGDTITKSGSAAVAPAKLGKKVGVKEGIAGDLVANAASNGDANAKRVQDRAVASAGNVVKEEDLETPLPPGAEEIAADLGDEDPHAEGPEAAAAMDQGAEEGAEDVSVDAETAEQVVNAISKQYPGAVITISVQLPEGTPFDTGLVAAAQEVVGTESPAEGELDPAVDAPSEDPNLDGVPPENPEKDAADELMEKRKIAITKTRKQIKEMFARMQSEEAPVDDVEAAPEGEAAPEAELGDEAGGDEAGAELEGEPEALSPEVEVSDTKIALSPEQWGQVLATSDLLNAGSDEQDVGSEIDVAGSEDGMGDVEAAPEGGEVDGEIDEISQFKKDEIAHELRNEPNGVDSRDSYASRPKTSKRQAIYNKLVAKGMAPERANAWLDSKGIMENNMEQELAELRTEVEGPNLQIKKVVEPTDKKKDVKKIGVNIKKPSALNESFNAELAGYADALQKLMQE